MKAAEKIIAVIKNKGGRITKPRKLMVDFFCSKPEPRQVSEIAAFLKKSGHSINRATIYREIGFLEKTDIIKKIFLADGILRYEASFQQRHHHHIFCLKCKKIGVLELKNRTCAKNLVLEANGFMVLGHSIELFGICAQCQK
jgi:Fe2+ or Zn2+ uptake regulation protein